MSTTESQYMLLRLHTFSVRQVLVGCDKGFCFDFANCIMDMLSGAMADRRGDRSWRDNVRQGLS